jgi:hypothetical protein
MELCIGVTGHRDLVEDEKPALETRLRAFFGGLAEQFPGLDLQLISALAEGADRLAARVALEMGIELIALLPMEQSDYERDFSSAESLSEFRAFLESAGQRIQLPPAAGAESDSLEQGSASRDRQYAQLGVFISNHCQVLLALWDGKPSDAVGGTAQVVRYHLTGAMEGFVEGQAAADLLANNENDLVFHIACSRQQEQGEPGNGLNPLDASWITSLHGRVDSMNMPEEYQLMLDRLQEFDADEEKYLEEIESNGYSLLNDIPPLDLPAGVEQANRHYRSADWLAMHFQKRVHMSLRSTYFLAALMGLAFLLYSEYTNLTWMVMLFLALFFTGVVFHFIGERRQWHRKYLDYRALAEGLRVQIYWNLSGVVDPVAAGFAYDSFLNKQDVDLGWIRHVMRSASMQRARGQAPEPAWVSWVIEQWIGQEGHGDGQLAYYSRKKLQNAIHHRRTGLLGQITLWCGIAVAFFLLLFGSDVSEEQMRILMILMGALPLIAGVRDAYAHKKAEKELIRQYEFMSRIFGNARQLLDQSGDLIFQRRVLRALGEAALEEGAEWILMHRERPLEYSGL